MTTTLTREDAGRLARVVNSKPIARRDRVARQFGEGGYTPLERFKDSGEYVPWTEELMVSHLMGQQTLGHYLVDEGGTCKVLAYDLDIVKPEPPERRTWNPELVWKGTDVNPRELWLSGEDLLAQEVRTECAIELWCVAHALAERITSLLDVPAAILWSGCKGLHVYGLVGPSPAGDIREAAREVLDSYSGAFLPTKGSNFFANPNYPFVEIETFPKQAEIASTGFGNLLRCPLGVHRKTGRESFFIRYGDRGWHEQGDDFFWVADDPIEALTRGTLRG